MADTFLQTKLQIPILRSSLVLRPHLTDRLNAGMGGRLFVISAPAGYGKTTLVSKWLGQSNHPAAWLSLDESDNDPRRFLGYFLAALKQIKKNVGASVDAMLQAQQPPPNEVILTALVNEISSFVQPFILILDDYHSIHIPLIHTQLNFLLEHQPQQMHLVIITREDPPLSLPRLRARGQLTEIRQNDLRFSPDECSDFLRRVMGLDLSPEEVAVLERRTEGWIAGLQLAALSMQGQKDVTGFIQAFAGSSRFILDYLIDEVFEQQSPDVKEFLLKTSILERLSGPLCDAVAERTFSQGLLEELEKANLFIIPLDQSRIWYRYHRLFVELLRHRSRISSIAENKLHQRASQWYEDHNLPSDAIQHALSAQDWERATRLIGQTVDNFLKRGELMTVIGWYQRVPKELIRAQPDFGMAYAWALLLLGKSGEAEELLDYFEEIGQEMPMLLGQVATAQAYSARTRGNNQRVIEKSVQALILLPENDIVSRCAVSLNLGLVYWHEGRLREAMPTFNNVRTLALQSENRYASLTAEIFLARTLVSQGVLRQAEEMLRKTVQTGGQNPILTLAHYDLSGIYYEWNELEKAWKHMELGLEISTGSGNVEFQNGGHLLKACLMMAQGNMPGALAEAKTTHALSTDFGPATQARSKACHAQVALAMGDVAAAGQWAKQISEDVDVNSFYRFIGLTKARLLLAQGDKMAAREVLDERFAKATQAGWGYAVVAIRALQALAAETEEAALKILAEGLKLSQPEGFIRTYVEAGAGLIPLLQKSAARRGIIPEYIGQILNAYDAKARSTQPLVEPLSERELEVLRLMTVGLSNREIAEQLVISTGTAKTHIHNLCGKLGVRNRTEAAMRARELGLI